MMYKVQLDLDAQKQSDIEWHKAHYWQIGRDAFEVLHDKGTELAVLMEATQPVDTASVHLTKGQTWKIFGQQPLICCSDRANCER